MKGRNIMNKELIKLDNNTGIVSNEVGTLNIVKTNNQKFSIEQILKTENDLEESSIYLNFLKKKLNKKYSPSKYIINMILTIIASILISLTITINPITLTYNLAIASKILLGLAPSLLITKSYLFKNRPVYIIKETEEDVKNTPDVSYNNQVNLQPEKVQKLILTLKK